MLIHALNCDSEIEQKLSKCFGNQSNITQWGGLKPKWVQPKELTIELILSARELKSLRPKWHSLPPSPVLT